MLGVIVKMQDAEKLSLEQIQAFLDASEGVRFEGEERGELCGWITAALRQQGYREQGKRVRGLLLRYVGKMTGFSRSQVTRLVSQYMEHRDVAVNTRTTATGRTGVLRSGRRRTGAWRQPQVGFVSVLKTGASMLSRNGLPETEPDSL